MAVVAAFCVAKTVILMATPYRYLSVVLNSFEAQTTIQNRHTWFHITCNMLHASHGDCWVYSLLNRIEHLSLEIGICKHTRYMDASVAQHRIKHKQHNESYALNASHGMWGSRTRIETKRMRPNGIFLSQINIALSLFPSLYQQMENVNCSLCFSSLLLQSCFPCLTCPYRFVPSIHPSDCCYLC